MQLIELVLRERSGYRDMPLRPYGGDATPELVRMLDHDTRGGSDIAPAALSRAAGRIIRPVSKTHGSALITNGWGEKRFMFIMKVEVRRTRTAISILEISGYTDHVGAVNSIRGIKLDEDMALYFNSVTEVNQSYMDTPTGGGWRTQIASSNHIIAPQTLPDFSRDRLSPGTMTMRPEDIFHNNPKNVIQNAFQRRAQKENWLDMRHGFTGSGLRMSNRLNDSSTRFLHRSLRALATANEGEVFGQENQFDRDTSRILKDARSQVREKTISGIPVMAEIARDTNIMEQGFITYGELVTMNPDFQWDDVKVYFETPETARDFRNTTGWGGKDNTTIAATQIARALPAFMAFHHIGYVEIEADNMSAMGEAVVVMPQVLPMLGQRVTERSLVSFEERLITELFVDMLPWENCMFEVTIRAGLSDSIIIDIKLEGEDPGSFTFPVFCDSLVAPVVVDSQGTIENMSETITGIVDSLGSTYRSDDDTGLDDAPSILTSSQGFKF